MSPDRSDWQTGPERFHLGAREIHVWRSSLDLTAEEQAGLEATLDKEELDRASRFATDRLRNRWVVGRGIVRTLLGGYLDEAPATLRFRYGEHEKPYLTGRLQASTLQFNVSHSHGLGLFAFSREREIGVDVEWIRDDLEQGEIASRFFSSAESTWLSSLPLAEQVDQFFALWTCKEAFVKALGGGISFGLSRFDVQLEPGADSALILSNEEGEDFSPWVARQLNPGVGFAGALAVGEPDLAISLRDWSSDRG